MKNMMEKMMLATVVKLLHSVRRWFIATVTMATDLQLHLKQWNCFVFFIRPGVRPDVSLCVRGYCLVSVVFSESCMKTSVNI